MAKGNPNRQKMINMMYLVLTALLALNVSKSILKAFELVNHGLDKTNATFVQKNNDTYDQFKAAVDINAKGKPAYEAAMQVQTATKEMYDYIEGIKKELEKRGDGYELPEEKADLRKQDDSEVGLLYFADKSENPEAEGNGEKLRLKLDGYKKHGSYHSQRS
jgi:gliding motility-associated protein GldM